MTAADDQRVAAETDHAMVAAATGAFNMFRLYSAYLAAGFTSDQAMAVILTIVKHGLENGK